MADYYLNAAAASEGDGSVGSPFKTLDYALKHGVLYTDDLYIVSGVYFTGLASVAFDVSGIRYDCSTYGTVILDSAGNHQNNGCIVDQYGSITSAPGILTDSYVYAQTGVMDETPAWYQYGVIGANNQSQASTQGTLDKNQVFHSTGYIDASGNYSAGSPAKSIGPWPITITSIGPWNITANALGPYQVQ